jgi:hypothetical protein
LLWLFLCSLVGATFVDLKAQIEALRKRRAWTLFRYGWAGNILFAIYFLICGFIALLLSTVAVERLPESFAWPGSVLMLKTFYLGFAVSTNGAFISKALKVYAGRADDLRTRPGYEMSLVEMMKRQLLQFQDQLSDKL